MAIDRCLVLEQQRFVRSVRDTHEVDVAELRPSLTPVCVRENVVPSNFGSGFDLATFGHPPMKESVIARDALTCGGRLYVLEKSREPADDPPRAQRAGDVDELRQRDSRLVRARSPWVGCNLIYLELALESSEHAPLQRVQIHDLRVEDAALHLAFRPGLDSPPPHVSHAEREKPPRRHYPVRRRAGFCGEEITVPLHRERVWNLERRPEAVHGPRGFRVRRSDYNVP